LVKGRVSLGEDKEKDISERVTTLEEQVKGIGEVKLKVDQLYNLLMEMRVDNVSSKSDLVLKTDCSSCRKDLLVEIDDVRKSNQKIFWTLISSGSVFMLWLLEQLLHVTLKLS
jgi:hypothetical protein